MSNWLLEFDRTGAGAFYLVVQAASWVAATRLGEAADALMPSDCHFRNVVEVL